MPYAVTPYDHREPPRVFATAWGSRKRCTLCRLPNLQVGTVIRIVKEWLGFAVGMNAGRPR